MGNQNKRHLQKYLFLTILLFPFWSWSDSALKQLNSKQPLQFSEMNSLTLLVYPAGKKLDWETPGSLIRSVVWNTLTGQKQPLGHMDVFLRCENESPVLTGMSRIRTWTTYKDVLIGGNSLNLLTAQFPGYLLPTEKVLSYLRPALKEGKVRAMTFALHPLNCSRLLKYYREYKKRGFEKTYSGFTSSVYAGEGAGCAAFAMSFLHVAGLLTKEMQEEWSRHLSVPVRLIAKDQNPPNMWSYIFGRNEAWARENEPSLQLLIYDPEKIYEWLGLFPSEKHPAWGHFEVIATEKALEIQVGKENENPVTDFWSNKWPPEI
jgi:hypothetical protein